MTQRPLRARESTFVGKIRQPISGQRGIVLLLTLLATAAVALVRMDASWSPWTVWIPTCVSAGIAIGAMLAGYQIQEKQTPGWGGLILQSWLILYPIPMNFLVQSLYSSIGEPLELLMLVAVQQAALIAVTMYATKKGEWIAGLLSFFLFLFCVTMTNDRVVYLLAGVFGLLSLWWLMGAYWERLQGGFVAQQSVPVVRLRAGILVSLLLLLCIMAYFGSHRTTTLGAWMGFMPTSGGTGDSDESARSGIGDGDRVVAAQESAMSFGPVESELFLEDTSPSLYDMFSDIYGEDPKVTKRSERAVSLGGAEGPQKHQHLSQSQKSSREFSAVRRAKSDDARKPENKLTAAMFYLNGATPAHLPMETFDAFDGRQWMHQQVPQAHELSMYTVQDKPWVQFLPAGAVSYALKPQIYGIKLINLKSPRIPAPHLTSRVHIDKVNQWDFYGITADGIPEMVQREHIPQLTVLHIQSLIPHLHALRKTSYFQVFAGAVRGQGISISPEAVRKSQVQFDREQESRGPNLVTTPLPSAPQLIEGPSISSDSISFDKEPASQLSNTTLSQASLNYYQVPVEFERLTELAKNWTKGETRGWGEVDAIVTHLREEFEYDPKAVAPEDCENVVAYFLQTGRGPDYLFATTAAMLLRTRGFATRLATGFYADPKDYEYSTGQTVVRKEDLHTWLQVSIDGKNWISVEATPGFLSPIEQLTIFEWSELLLWRTYQWAYRHPLLIVSAICVLASVLWYRVWLFEICLTVWASLAGSMGTMKGRVMWTLWLLQWRGKLRGRPRAQYKTLRSWLREATNGTQETQAAVTSFLPEVERLLYGPGNKSMQADEDKLRQLCHYFNWNRYVF